MRHPCSRSLLLFSATTLLVTSTNWFLYIQQNEQLKKKKATSVKEVKTVWKELVDKTKPSGLRCYTSEEVTWPHTQVTVLTTALFRFKCNVAVVKKKKRARQLVRKWCHLWSGWLLITQRSYLCVTETLQKFQILRVSAHELVPRSRNCNRKYYLHTGSWPSFSALEKELSGWSARTWA